MAEEADYIFKTTGLTEKERDQLEDFRRLVEKREKRRMDNKDLLMWIVVGRTP